MLRYMILVPTVLSNDAGFCLLSITTPLINTGLKHCYGGVKQVMIHESHPILKVVFLLFLKIKLLSCWGAERRYKEEVTVWFKHYLRS